MKKKLLSVMPVSAMVSMAAAAPAFAAESGGADVSGMLTTAMTTVQADMLGTITSLTPIALVVVGAVMAVKFGVKFFRGLAK